MFRQPLAAAAGAARLRLGCIIGAAVLTACAAARSAAASVDLTGAWRLGDPVTGLPVQFTQTGTQLTAVVPGLPSIASGTIDAGSGAFAIDLASLYNENAPPGFPGLCTYALDAVAAPDGNSFTGTVTSAQFCIPPPFTCSPGSCASPITISASGARTLCPDGIVEPGEVCDDGLINGCCSLYPAPCLAFQPPGTTCADDGDPLTNDVCDGAGTCTHPHVLCPNGVLDPGEECDDGNTSFTDCCYLCRFRPTGATCDDDGDPLTRDICDGAGTCQHVRCGNHALDAGEVCDYSLPGACCATDCQSTLLRGTTCQADPFSNTPDICDGEGHCVQALSCGLQPNSGCRPDLGGSRLVLRSAGSKSRVSFRWKGSAGQTVPADLGNPLAQTAVQLCVYTPSAIFTAMVPGGDVCGGRPCWAQTGIGFHYRDPAGTMRGIQRARMSARPDKSILSFDGSGSALPMPNPLPMASVVTAQLLVFEPGATRCWEAVYATPSVSTQTDLRASH
jgi:hypothetical protein